MIRTDIGSVANEMHVHRSDGKTSNPSFRRYRTPFIFVVLLGFSLGIIGPLLLGEWWTENRGAIYTAVGLVAAGVAVTTSVRVRRIFL